MRHSCALFNTSHRELPASPSRRTVSSAAMVSSVANAPIFPCRSLSIFQRIFTIGWADPQMPLLLLLLVVSVWVYQFVHESPLRGWLEKPPVKIGLAVVMILWMLLFAPGGGEPFIYFQF